MTNTVIVAYIDTICNPYGKHICINTIWVPYDIAIGAVIAITVCMEKLDWFVAAKTYNAVERDQPTTCMPLSIA